MIVGFILRKRVYDSVDRLEGMKMDIMNRNIATELARIKKLNLSGETQEKFEAWKKRWELIIAQELPDIEEYLFDAENAADRYRFPSANKSLQKIEKSLSSIENDIEDILQELEELLQSEKTSRIEIEQLQSNLNQFVTTISQNRYEYGKAVEYFEAKIKSIKAEIATYDELVEMGNYLAGKELVTDLSVKMDTLEVKINEFPEVYTICKNSLPAQLKDLSIGLDSMKEDGYRVEHLGFDKDIQNYEQRLEDCMASLEKGNVAEVKGIITEMEDGMKEMYDSLEQEALDKNYLEAQFPTYEESLKKVGVTFSETKSEVELLRKTYYFEDDDMEEYLTLDKKVTTLQSQLNELSNKLNSKTVSHSELRAQLESGFEQLEKMQEKHEEFKERINNLRKDELEAKEKLSKMGNQIIHINRKLRTSNLPGVPDFIWEAIDTASERNNRVIEVLENQPLDIGKVQHALKEAETAVDYALEQTDTMIEQAFLTEQVIQYANRYRSRYPLLAANLAEAERLFRSYEYEIALEHVAKAVEEVEPGALSRIEVHLDAIN